MSANPRVAFPSQTQVFSYTDGTLFEGFILLGIRTPAVDATGGSQAYPPKVAAYSTSNTRQFIPMPVFTKIYIKSGLMESTTGVIFSNDLVPPGFQYVAWLYHLTTEDVPVTGFSTPVLATISPFAITATPFTIPGSFLTLALPGGGTSPNPN